MTFLSWTFTTRPRGRAMLLSYEEWNVYSCIKASRDSAFQKLSFLCWDVCGFSYYKIKVVIVILSISNQILHGSQKNSTLGNRIYL